MPETAENEMYALLLEAGKSITSEVELEKLVQKITDIGTELSGAQFGAFFYNTLNKEGENYILYTISGVPREAFSKFPMPRNTAIFHPTFAGLSTVRYDDVTKQKHYGQMEPHFGMPKGHLPVTSYLATPVISPVTKEVIGGLFFGHSEPGIFSERSEKLIEGVATQAAIAMDNAQLFQANKKAEKVLNEQKERYRNIFHSATDAMIIFDNGGEVLEANLAASEMLGYSIENLTRKSGQSLFPGTGELFSAIASITGSGRQFQGLGKVLSANEKELDVRINASQFIYRETLQLLMVMNRSEADKQLEEELVKSEVFADTIANVSPVTLWMTNQNGETIYINQAWTDMVGGRVEDHLGTGWLNAIVESDRESASQKFIESFAERKVYDHDFRIRRKDGAIRWSTTVGGPYFLPDGSFGGFAGSLTDITERKLSEEKLFSQNTLINTITNNTMQALFLMDSRQHCTYMNPAAELMTGFKLEEVLEKPLHYYVHHTHPDGRHFPIEDCLIDRALPTRMQTTGEEVFIRKNGEFFPVAFVASPIIENGIPIGTVIEARDTTEEKRIHESLRNKEKEAMTMLEQKVKERTAELEKINFELMQFTSVASHDLKEPVRKVAIFSQRAKDIAKEFANDHFHNSMDNVIKSAKRMAMLIDDLLEFARISQTNLTFQPVDLNSLLVQIKDDLQVAIAEKKATIDFEPLPIINGIEIQLGQVFQNLISNSLKFSHPDRSPLIKITSEIKEDRLIIHYTDNGIGFENDLSERIFELFERLHNKGQFEGTGIGLAIAKKIIMLHEGEITATGVRGEGAHFTITLPYQSQVNN